jgi:predicted PurR-regulated permease PerM
MEQEKAASLRSLPQPWAIIFPLAVRFFVWGLFFGVIFILRSFFLLIFLTFVFAYIQNTGIKKLEPYIKSRVPRVVFVALFFIGAIVYAGAFVGPRVKTQATNFLDRYPTYIQAIDNEINDLTEKAPILLEILPEEFHPTEEIQPWGIAHSPTVYFLEKAIGLEEKSDGEREIESVVATIRDLGGSLASIVSSFLLALLFSFLILLDLKTLRKSVTELHDTRISFIYDEVSDSVYSFCRVLGRAFEAQLIIALFNTFLTAIGIQLLGLDQQIAFLLLIVFLCSFIPVAGVFISSVPICLVALQTGGLQLVVLAIVLITIIHLIEAYILNPRIYGSRMHLNPVIVLMILTIGGKLFHVWGFILGVPVFTYIFGHAIRRPVVVEVQQKELAEAA